MRDDYPVSNSALAVKRPTPACTPGRFWASMLSRVHGTLLVGFKLVGRNGRLRSLAAGLALLAMTGGVVEGLPAASGHSVPLRVDSAAVQVGGRGLPGGLVAVATVAQPLERRLSAGATGLLRAVRKRLRQFGRNLRVGMGRWSTWFVGLVVFGVLAVIVPLLGRESLRTFRQQGLAAFMRELSLAAAVYLRLLIDSRTPLVGKALLTFAVVYGAASHDLIPDRRAAQTFVDDVILLILASRCFLMLCAQEIVDEHAVAADRARARNLQKKLGRRQRAVKQRARQSPAAESQ